MPASPRARGPRRTAAQAPATPPRTTAGDDEIAQRVDGCEAAGSDREAAGCRRAADRPRELSSYCGGIESWELIGKGSFGRVYKAELREHGPCTHDAVKVVDVEDTQAVSAVRLEESILRELNSKYVVQYRGCFLSPAGGICVAMEYCGGGSFEPLAGHLTEVEIAACVHSVLQGLVYLHSARVLHRDVKAANVLLTESGEVRLADFGTSTACVRSLRHTFVGSPYWMAPEMITDTPYDGRADVWSLGVTVIELAEGDPPHVNSSTMLALQKIARGPAPRLKSRDQAWSAGMQRFVQVCCEKSIESRPASSAVSADPGCAAFLDAGAGADRRCLLAAKNRVQQHAQQAAAAAQRISQSPLASFDDASDQDTFVVLASERMTSDGGATFVELSASPRSQPCSGASPIQPLTPAPSVRAATASPTVQPPVTPAPAGSPARVGADCPTPPAASPHRRRGPRPSAPLPPPLRGGQRHADVVDWLPLAAPRGETHAPSQPAVAVS
eukprot:TRINITY_DN43399_c0_g1_i1.p1 TRINITY_DN43399_c0_g1~~TRINITY_DN43399_c0_g1_i1.p1  ORF type:complete len:523 (+),score=56.52 TRINITY_DN43399_c0_g1_i1:70-1569(+)